MKRMKKTALSLLGISLLCTLMLVSACKKEAGPAGKDGNANVKVFMFYNKTLTAGNGVIDTIPISTGALDSSLALMYYTDSANTANKGIWYSSPGLGRLGAYQTRNFFLGIGASSSFTLSVFNPDGTSYSGSSLKLPQLKVVVVPASSYIVGKKEDVDFSDYKATMQYLGLPE